MDARRVRFAVALALLLSACAQPAPGPHLSPAEGPFRFSFDAPGGCAAGGPPLLQLAAQPGDLTLSGRIATGGSCPALSARSNLSGETLRLEIRTEGGSPCAPCPGSVSLSARWRGLPPGFYTVLVSVDGLESGRPRAYIP